MLTGFRGDINKGFKIENTRNLAKWLFTLSRAKTLIKI